MKKITFFISYYFSYDKQYLHMHSQQSHAGNYI